MAGLCRLFGISCQDVYVKLVSQIKAWRIQQSCSYVGEKCSYEVRHVIVGRIFKCIYLKRSVLNSRLSPVRDERALTLSCAAVGVGVSLPDQSHAHVFHHQEGQRPGVPAGAVHHLQNDGTFPPRQVGRLTSVSWFQAVIRHGSVFILEVGAKESELTYFPPEHFSRLFPVTVCTCAHMWLTVCHCAG